MITLPPRTMTAMSTPFFSLRITGFTLLIEAAAMLLPMGVALLYGENPIPFLSSILIILAAACVPVGTPKCWVAGATTNSMASARPSAMRYRAVIALPLESWRRPACPCSC